MDEYKKRHDFVVISQGEKKSYHKNHKILETTR